MNTEPRKPNTESRTTKVEPRKSNHERRTPRGGLDNRERSPDHWREASVRKDSVTIRRTWRSIRVRAGRCGAVLTAALVSWAVLSQTAPALGGSWSATGADSLDVSVIGFYPIVSARGIWDCAAFVPPGGHEYALVCADSLHLVDLADPTAPQRTAVIAPAVASNFVDVAVRGR